jgi:hypothetical protein
MNELIKQRLIKYFAAFDNHPFHLAVLSVIDEPDEIVAKFYTPILDYPNKFIFADIFSLIYLSIRNVYDLPYLHNIKYRNKKPSTTTIFGENLSILSSITLIIETISELFKLDQTMYENNQDLIPTIMGSLSNFDINPFQTNNLEQITHKMLEEYNKIIKEIR